MSILMGLEIGKRGILTNQTALNITGHNISNANTEGYTRQVADLVATRPWCTPSLNTDNTVGQLGTGVDIDEIKRIRDEFVDAQIRNESRTSGYWTKMEETLGKIEVIVNEPSDDGLRTVLDEFWASWQDLSANPESDAARAVVAQRGEALADTFNHTYNQLVDLRDDLNTSIGVKVDEINSIGQQLRDLNQQILSVNIAGKQPNDLLDKRDLLLDKLSKIVDINIHQEDNGMVAVQIGGRTLVQGIEMNKLSTDSDTNGMYMVVWDDTRTKVNIGSYGGELRGLLDARGKTELSQDSSSNYKETVSTLMDELSTMAKTIVITTNNLHRGGYSLNKTTDAAYPDGINFFEPIDESYSGNWAEAMKVSADITNDVKNIAASEHSTWDSSGTTKTNFGDGNNALKIAQLKQLLNAGEYWTASGDLGLTFPSTTISGSVTINYDGTGYEITPDIPTEGYADLQELADAIQTKINANSTLNGNIEVRCDGKKLVFYSASNKFTGVTDGDSGGLNTLLGGTSFSTLQTSPADLVTDVTTDDYWRSIAANIGVQSQEATRMVTNQETLISELEDKRQSVSGVSLDEEMTNMIKYQHAYNAASRFITTIDEQLDRIINNMGIVGR